VEEGADRKKEAARALALSILVDAVDGSPFVEVLSVGMQVQEVSKYSLTTYLLPV